MTECRKELNIDSLRQRVRNVKRLNGQETSQVNEDYFIATHLMHDIVKNIGQQFDNSMQEEGLVGAAWMVLMMTYSSEEQKIIATDICENLAQNKSTISRIIESLIEKKFLIRQPDEVDRRKIYLHVTEQGKQYVQKKLIPHGQYQLSLWDGVDIEILLPQLIRFWNNTRKIKIGKNNNEI